MECAYCDIYLVVIDSYKTEETDSCMNYHYIGECPNCKKRFQWNEFYTLKFEGFFDIEEI